MPGIINVPEDSMLENNNKTTTWMHLCPICYEAAIEAAVKEWGTKFPSA
jgi:hypothetical protein|tara:strand:+ start:111 stop:257 length:147 start_codon:yes stop_codon:yes gene_type:complete